MGMGTGLALLKLISTAPRAQSQVLAWEEGLMTPIQQTQAESHLGSGEPVVSGAAVGGRGGGICLGDLHLSARGS